MKVVISSAVFASLLLPDRVLGLSVSRRDSLSWIAGGIGSSMLGKVNPSNAVADMPDSFDVDNYLKTGMVQMPMGVSGQAGKSRPETGVVLRDGSEVLQSRNGDVLAEILLKGSNNEKTPVLASYSSPWPLATGTVFDVECRDMKNGDSAFLSVTSNTGGKDLDALPDSFFVDQLFSPTGRFSFYGQPTDIKVKRSKVVLPDSGNKQTRVLDLSFSTLSQSTQTEIPRKARLVATIPSGTTQAVVLVASASATRWKKGSEDAVNQVIASFNAIPAPTSGLKVRAKERRSAA